MNKTNKITAILVGLFLSISSISIAQNISNKMDSVSYSIGVLFAKSMQQQGVDEVNPEIVAKAMNDYFSGEMTVMPADKCEQMYQGYLSTVARERSAKAREEGEMFLAENAKREEVNVTESGLQYEVITAGDGAKPTANDKVKTHYHGTLINGEVFDSSVDRGEPISFPVGGVIKGWQEALQLMSVGDKWKLYIPSDLAYGERGAGAKIPPHSVLIFEIELLDIE